MVTEVKHRDEQLHRGLAALSAGRDVVLVSFYRVDAFDMANELVKMAKREGIECANVSGESEAPRVRIREYGDVARRGRPMVIYDSSCWFGYGSVREARVRSVFA